MRNSSPLFRLIFCKTNVFCHTRISGVVATTNQLCILPSFSHSSIRQLSRRILKHVPRWSSNVHLSLRRHFPIRPSSKPPICITCISKEVNHKRFPQRLYASKTDNSVPPAQPTSAHSSSLLTHPPMSFSSFTTMKGPLSKDNAKGGHTLTSLRGLKYVRSRKRKGRGNERGTKYIPPL